MVKKTANKRRWVLESPTMLLRKGDQRYDDFVKYKAKHGFSPDELWSLNFTILNFVLPRLKEFKKTAKGSYPGCFDDEGEWQDILGKMIDGISIAIEADDSPRVLSDEENELKKKGINLFLEYFNALWY